MRYNASPENLDDGATRAHLIRYFFAKGFVSPKMSVLDIASGTGYGSRLLAEVADVVYAFDQIDDINQEHRRENIIYTKHDLNQAYDYPDVDVFVCLETLEHLEMPKVLLDSAMPHVRKFFVYSVPLDEVPGANPFHVQQFTKNSILNLVHREGWKEFHSLMQGNHYLGVMYRL